jgi:hypothetical protein
MAGETEIFTVDFSSRLSPGETIGSPQVGIQSWIASPVQDPNAEGLIIGSPFIGGTSAAAVCGGPYVKGSAGFQPDAVYQVWFEVVTSNGRTLEQTSLVVTLSYAPPILVGNMPEFVVTISIAPAIPGTYYVLATGITVTIPTGGFASPMIFVDKTGAVDPAMNFSGALLNSTALTDVLPRGGSVTLTWSNLFSGYYSA